MKNFLITAGVTTVMVFAAAENAQAQIPVTDSISIGQDLQQFATVVAQLRQLEQQVQNTLSQIRVAEDQLNSLTGDYGLSDLANSQAFKDLRRTADWDDIFSGVSSNTNGPIQTKGREVIAEYGLVEGANLFESGEDSSVINPLIVVHEKSRDAVAAGAGLARVTMEASDSRVDVYEAFIDQIASSPNAKSSTDLLARIMAENGLLMNEVIRLSAANLEMQQTMLARELASDQADANFFSDGTTPTTP